MIKEDKTEIVNSAINKIAHILYRQVYSYEIDPQNAASRLAFSELSFLLS